MNGVACTTAWSRVALNVALSAADTGSGVAQIRYTTTGTAPTATTGTVYAGPFAVTTPTTLMYRAFDVAGNAGAVATLNLRVDLDTPDRDRDLQRRELFRSVVPVADQLRADRCGHGLGCRVHPLHDQQHGSDADEHGL